MSIHSQQAEEASVQRKRGGVRRGRPRSETQELRLYVKPTTREHLREIAEHNDLSMSEIADRLVAKYMKKAAKRADIGEGSTKRDGTEVGTAVTKQSMREPIGN